MFANKQLRHILSHAILRNLYFTLIHPQLYDGILVSGFAKETILRKTKILHTRVICVINKAYF